MRGKQRKLNPDGGYMGDRYPLCDNLPGQIILKRGATYHMIGNITLPEVMKDDKQ